MKRKNIMLDEDSEATLVRLSDEYGMSHSAFVRHVLSVFSHQRSVSFSADFAGDGDIFWVAECGDDKVVIISIIPLVMDIDQYLSRIGREYPPEYDHSGASAAFVKLSKIFDEFRISHVVILSPSGFIRAASIADIDGVFIESPIMPGDLIVIRSDTAIPPRPVESVAVYEYTGDSIVTKTQIGSRYHNLLP